MTDLEIDEKKRRILFVPCGTRAALHMWIKEFLGVDLPDVKVDPDSTSTPMDVVWEVYSSALKNDREDFGEVLAYASRDSFKTLIASILEILCVVHLGRSVAHMAAIESQAKKAQSYVKKFFNMPMLRNFIVGDNARTTQFVRYYNSETGESLTQKQYGSLQDSQRVNYTEISHYIAIIICTLSGTNCVDPNTLITRSDGARCHAFELKEGDAIRSFDTATKLWTKESVKRIWDTRKQSIRITMDDGSSLVCSDDHPVLTTAGWRTAWTLRVNNRVLQDGAGGTAESPQSSMDFRFLNPKSALLGTLLGDSSVTWPKNKLGVKYGVGPRFQVSHTVKQADYIRRKCALLQELGISCSYGLPDARSIVKVTSSVTPWLSEIFGLVYPDGKKRVSKELLDQLDEEGIAFWLMDDGSGNPEAVGSRKDRRISIATCSFSQEENELIVGWFRARWELDCWVGSVSNQSGKSYPQIVFSLESSRRLSEMVSPFFSPSFKYKLPPPLAYLISRCVDCGDRCSSNRNGFSRCPQCNKKSKSRAGRAEAQSFRRMFHRTIKKIEHVGTVDLIDIQIDTQQESRKNFVANSIVVHNSEHVPFMCVDELDVIANPMAYEEAKMIPSVFDDKLPITLYISTRKFSYGLVQKEIDNAEQSGLQIRHWNIIDVTQRCSPKRHRPDLPMVDVYYSDELLTTIDTPTYDALASSAKEKYKKDTAYSGCMSNCKLFAVCRGRLATVQKAIDPKAKVKSYLKPISHVQRLFGKISLSTAQAQLMSRKPEEKGLIYPTFDPEVHMISAASIAQSITGDHFPESMTKAQLMALLKERGSRFSTGMDFGYTHCWSAVTAVIDGQRCFVLDAMTVPELQVSQQILLCNEKILHLEPKIHADPENPQAILDFRKAGYKISGVVKGRGSVLGGIDVVRTLLQPGIGPPRLFFLKNDPDGGCDFLRTVLRSYHWMLDVAGNPTSEPDDEDDDVVDALRYLVMANFSSKVKIAPMPQGAQAQVLNPAQSIHWGQIMGELKSVNPGASPELKGKKGKFFFDL